MKKIITLSIILSMMTSSLTAFAYDKPQAADLPEKVTEQLIGKNVDKNEDGIITEEEFCNAELIQLDLDGIDSIDFLTKLKDPKYIYLSNGNISDFSPLAKFKDLETLQLSQMPQVTDISFAKDMDLLKFYIVDLEQITDEQKIEVMKFHDADIPVGFSDYIGATPIGMFEYNKLSLEIADTDIASFFDMLNDEPIQTCAEDVFGKSEGSTEYTLKLKGKEIHKGKINIAPNTPETLPDAEKQPEPQIYFSEYYSGADKVILQNNTLYKLTADKMEPVAEKVAAFDRDYTYDEEGEFTTIETILYEDGTVEINGQKLSDAEGLKFKHIGNALCVTDKGDVYAVRIEGGKFVIDLIYKGFGGFLENSSMNFLSDTGELVQIELKYKDKTTIGYQAFPTGITDVTSSYNDYFIDKNKDMWKIYRHVGSEPSVAKCAEDVVYVGYRHYSGGSTYGCVHITSDGTAYSAGTTRKVILSGELEDILDYKNRGTLYMPVTPGVAYGTTHILGDNNYYILSKDNVLCMAYKDQKASVADVKRYISPRESADGKKKYFYFLKNDNTIWRYSLEDKEYTKVSEDAAVPPSPEKVKGDLNGDGKFEVADAVLMQKWLLAVPDTKLKNWETGDFCKDGVLDVFDLCEMKKALKMSSSK